MPYVKKDKKKFLIVLSVVSLGSHANEGALDLCKCYHIVCDREKGTVVRNCTPPLLRTQYVETRRCSLGAQQAFLWWPVLICAQSSFPSIRFDCSPPPPTLGSHSVQRCGHLCGSHSLRLCGGTEGNAAETETVVCVSRVPGCQMESWLIFRSSLSSLSLPLSVGCWRCDLCFGLSLFRWVLVTHALEIWLMNRSHKHK